MCIYVCVYVCIYVSVLFPWLCRSSLQDAASDYQTTPLSRNANTLLEEQHKKKSECLKAHQTTGERHRTAAKISPPTRSL
ncbi:hypothetical protein DPEC_G00145660 [Dallia pectoralis]|uniref:Uncharacterized protein n=1 Tax=Dallia pectoralis TaxID=75939 RepID=A0ACC2GPI9_DALPE|nr:hypothetical protein DPEC_G00145660 [Dallia pectoralis]